jgi:hypothetical protein
VANSEGKYGGVFTTNALKAKRGNGDIAPFIPNLGNRWMLVVSLTPQPLYHHGKSAPAPTDEEVLLAPVRKFWRRGICVAPVGI